MSACSRSISSHRCLDSLCCDSRSVTPTALLTSISVSVSPAIAPVASARGPPHSRVRVHPPVDPLLRALTRLRVCVNHSLLSRGDGSADDRPEIHVRQSAPSRLRLAAATSRSVRRPSSRGSLCRTPCARCPLVRAHLGSCFASSIRSTSLSSYNALNSATLSRRPCSSTSATRRKSSSPSTSMCVADSSTLLTRQAGVALYGQVIDHTGQFLQTPQPAIARLFDRRIRADYGRSNPAMIARASASRLRPAAGQVQACRLRRRWACCSSSL